MNKWTNHKKIYVLAGIIGAFLLVFGGSISLQQETTETKEGEFYSVEFYTEYLEKRITDLCREVRGIDEVHVLVTLDGGSETMYAENQSGTASDYVILKKTDSEQALPMKEIYPVIRGVAVVCTRGDDSEIQRTVTELLCAALGISSASIRVAGT